MTELGKYIAQGTTSLNRLVETKKIGDGWSATESEPAARDLFISRNEDVSRQYNDFNTVHNLTIGLIEDADYKVYDKYVCIPTVHIMLLNQLFLNLKSKKLLN